MNRSKNLLCLTVIFLAVDVPCEAIKRSPVPPTRIKQVHHLTVIFANDSGSKVRAEMTCLPTSNSIAKPGLPEKHWVLAFREAKFVTGRTNKALQFALFRNGKKLGQQSFEPFQENYERRIRWDGTSLTLEDRHRQQDF